jgi:hypothetical protein
MPEGGVPRPKVPTTPVDVTGPEQVWRQYFGDEAEQQYLLNDLRERHLAGLLQDGDDYYWLKRKLSGTQCPYWDDQAQQCKKPLDPNATCYNTRYLGGYELPLAIKVALPTSEIQSVRQEGGLLKSQPMRPWTIWDPRLTDRDFLVHRVSGERFEVLNVQATGPWRGMIVCQFFDVRPMQIGIDFAMKVPIALIGGA